MATKHNVITTPRYRAYLNQNLYLTEFQQREERADAKLQNYHQSISLYISKSIQARLN